MMVDPMFMIVKNLRLFLTAVTPTAVTPTAVIFMNLGNFPSTKTYIGALQMTIPVFQVLPDLPDLPYLREVPELPE